MSKSGSKVIAITKIFFIVSLTMLGACILLNIFKLVHPAFHSRIIRALNILTPFVVLVYISLAFWSRFKLLKKISEYVHRIFSKN